MDSPDIGGTRPIWLEVSNEDDDGDIAEVNEWRTNTVNLFRQREELATLIAADITAYLADIDTHTDIPAATLAERQLRAAAWFGLYGYIDSENASLTDPYWNPLEWAWEQTAEHIAEYVANVAAEDVSLLYNGDRDITADKMTAAALVDMFAIPIDTITTRATEKLYTSTNPDTDSTGEKENKIPFPIVAMVRAS